VLQIIRPIFAVTLLAVLQMSPAAAQSSAGETTKPVAPPGHDFTLYYLGSFSSAKDLAPHNGICGAFGLIGRPPVQLPEASSKAIGSRCDTIVDGAVGSREFSAEDTLSLPYRMTSDSKDRIIVLDHGGHPSIHIFDFDRRKTLRIAAGPDNRLHSPNGLATDAQDQLYVTDAQLGAVLVYSPNGKFRRYVGRRQNQRLFLRPAGIAIDPASGHIYVVDPPRSLVLMLDIEGNILGKLDVADNNSGPGELAVSELVIRGKELFVLDPQNHCIQVFDLTGHFRARIMLEKMESARGFSVDNQGRIYLSGPLDTVQVYDREGRFLFRFGSTGGGYGQFANPTGVWIDHKDRIYVADTANQRVQSFEWGIKHGSELPHP
jgi:DNA-binding beta-propeller fold protein YncE